MKAAVKPMGEFHPKSTYICGVDVARQGKDETAIVVLEKLFDDDRHNVFVVYMETLNTPNLTHAIGRVQYLDKFYNFKKIICDETGIGAGLTDVLKSRLKGKVEGIWYTAKSKAEMFNNLKILMSRAKGKLYLPDYLTSNNPIVKKMYYQFLSIQQEFKEDTSIPKITHAEREHDDIVNAIALAASFFNVRGEGRRYPLGFGN